MASTKRKIKNRENLALARASRAAKKRKTEELHVTEQPLKYLSNEADSTEAGEQYILQQYFDQGQENDAEMINTVINTEATIIPPSDEVAAVERNNNESNGHNFGIATQDGLDEPDESVLPFIENAPPEIDANQSHDALVEEHSAVQSSVKTVVSPYANAKIPHDIAADALQRLDYILCPSKCVGTGYRPPKLDGMFSIRRLSAMAACLRFYINQELDWTLTRSSEIAAIGAGYGVRYGKKIRQFVRVFINTDDLPENQYGCHDLTRLPEYILDY
ncbi:hypothetical protein FRC07_012786 [Ceratobasidium sp. 392]|nr:hypothetical protein FRC07_012786 [Ceratobasidium sp. 392]